MGFYKLSVLLVGFMMSARWACKSLRDMAPQPFAEIRRRLEGKTDVINLSSGDPGFPTPAHVVDAAYTAMKTGATHYTMTSGIPELRAEIAEYQKKFGLDVNPDTEVIVTPGSQQALYLVLASILDPMDEILIPNPSYTVYSPIIKYLNGNPVLFPLDRDNGFHVDEEALRACVTPKTKAILLCSPNNPTGTVMNREDLEAVARVAKENDLLVLSDEIYSEFIWEGEHMSLAALPGMKERTVVFVSFSKTFSMTGWRLGYVIADKELTQLMLNLQGNMIISPPGFVQKAGVAALTGPWDAVEEMGKVYEKRVEYVAGRLDAMKGVKCMKPEGAFYVWADISELSESSEEFCNRLIDEQSVVAIAGVHFGSAGEGYIRLALVSDMNVLEKALDRIEAFVEG